MSCFYTQPTNTKNTSRIDLYLNLFLRKCRLQTENGTVCNPSHLKLEFAMVCQRNSCRNKLFENRNEQNVS